MGSQTGLLNLSAANGVGGSNVGTVPVGGPAFGLGSIQDNDGFGHFGGQSGGSNHIAFGGKSGSVNAGDGFYQSSGDQTGIANLTALNGVGGSNVVSAPVGGPAVGLGQIVDNDGFGHFGGQSGGSNHIALGGKSGSVDAGDGSFYSTGDQSGLVNVKALNGLGGSDVVSAPVGGPAVGLGHIVDNDGFGGFGKQLGSNHVAHAGASGSVNAGDGHAADTGSQDGPINVSAANGWGGSNIGSLPIGGPALGIGAIHDNDANGHSGGLSIGGNHIALGGNSGSVNAGDGHYESSGDQSGLVNISAANGWGGSNILSAPVGGPAIGIGHIADNDGGYWAANGYDNHVSMVQHDNIDVAPSHGLVGDVLHLGHALFEAPALDLHDHVHH